MPYTHLSRQNIRKTKIFNCTRNGGRIGLAADLACCRPKSFGFSTLFFPFRLFNGVEAA